MKCAVISGGKASTIDKNAYHYLIACDYGLQHCIDQLISPDIAIGDFDSYTAPISHTVRVMHFNKDKDDTDTLLAVKHAIELGYTEIDILCALGGRFDHQLANLQTLLYATNKGVKCRIVGDNDTIYAVTSGSLVLDSCNCNLSVFSLTSVCHGVTISGAKYTLSNAEMTNSYPIGVSNKFDGDNATITVREGTLAVVLSKE